MSCTYSFLCLASGMRVGQIRVVFSVPENAVRHLFHGDIQPPQYLAYIEWFTPFTRSPEPNSKMYRVKRAAHSDGRKLASIIPLSLVKQSVHLIPKWSHRVPNEWSSDNVLNLSPSFFLNSFKEHHTYFNVY